MFSQFKEALLKIIAQSSSAISNKLKSINNNNGNSSHLEEDNQNPNIDNRVESSLAETPSHTTVQALSHTAVLDLYFTNSSRRENKPIPLNQFKFSAL